MNGPLGGNCKAFSMYALYPHASLLLARKAENVSLNGKSSLWAATNGNAATSEET